jgi:hypothetical protein
MPAGRRRVRYAVAFLPLLALYVGIRLLAWRRTVLLEDTDSVGLIGQAQIYRSGDLARIAALDPDRTPLYPAVAALLGLPGWSPEFAARLASFVFALLLFLVLALLIRPLGERRGTLIGLFFLSLSPVLIPYAYAVLTEPAYTAIVSAGLLLFLQQYAEPSIGGGAALGVTFGAAFLCRTEGFLYLGMIPLFQAVHFGFAREPAYSRRRLLQWGAAYCTAFALLAAPQIWDVSRKMHGLAINGRQAWSVVLGDNLTGLARDARRAGLVYSPSRINVEAAWSDPALRARLVSHREPLNYAKIALKNLDEFDHEILGRTAGPVILICFGYGMLALVRRGRRFPVFTIGAFIAVALFAPMLQHLLPRHVMVVLPVMFVVAGIGTVELGRSFAPPGGRSPMWGRVIVAGVCGMWLLTEVRRIGSVLNPPSYNKEYNPAELREPARLVRALSADTGRELVIVARRPYLAFAVGGSTLNMPFATLPRLLRYIRLNDADFLFVEQSQIAAWPFLQELAARDSIPGLRRVYSKLTETNGRLELYRVEMASLDTTGESIAPGSGSPPPTRRPCRGSARGTIRAGPRGPRSPPRSRGR